LVDAVVELLKDLDAVNWEYGLLKQA